MVGQITNIAPSAGWHRSMTYYIEDNLVTCFASSFSQFNSLTRDANFWFSHVSFLLWTVSGPRPSPHRLCVSMTSIITATSSVFFNGIYLNTNLPHWVHYPQPCVLLVFVFFLHQASLEYSTFLKREVQQVCYDFFLAAVPCGLLQPVIQPHKQAHLFQDPAWAVAAELTLPPLPQRLIVATPDVFSASHSSHVLTSQPRFH